MQVLPAEPALPAESAQAPVTGVSYNPTERRLPSNAKFDPAVHLCYQPPSKKYTFEDLKLQPVGISPIAITEPFPLFTKEAVLELRKDCLSTEVHDNFVFSSILADYQAREFPASVAPFIHQAFTSPEFVRACSEAAGIELVPIMSLELGHTNFQAGSGGKDAIRSLPVEPSPCEPPMTEMPQRDGKAVVQWHHDAYPFVAVTMLSDVRNMIGGETAIETGDGSIAKIRGPDLGYTCVLQGRYVKHIACKAYNAKERITMVTSFRAKDVSVPDLSVLTTIRYLTKPNRINAQWSSYRLKLVAERMLKLANEIDEAAGEDIYAEKEICTRETMQKFLDEQTKYLQHGIDEMMPFSGECHPVLPGPKL